MRCDPRPQREHFRRQQNLSATAYVERRAALEVAVAAVHVRRGGMESHTITALSARSMLLVELGGGSLSGLCRGQHAMLGRPFVFVKVEEQEIRAHYAELRVAVVSYGDFLGEYLDVTMRVQQRR